MSVELQVSTRNPPQSIRILSLNCWGLKYLAKYRHERLSEIGRVIAASPTPPDIVGLQECWTYKDYASIREQTNRILPYGKFYYSGIFGGGLVILSRWPIEESSMYRYSLNGRPTAFFRGDWFVGKGVACARIRFPAAKPATLSLADPATRTSEDQIIEVFNTHLHAPYEREPNDSYICHRTAQAWEIAKLMRHAADRNSIVIGLGDFNMVPLSFAHRLIEGRGGGVKDVWRILKPESSIGSSHESAEMVRREQLGLANAPMVGESLYEHGHTCDTIVNTWRWSEQHRKDLEKGQDRKIDDQDVDWKAKRLDYIFSNAFNKGWSLREVKVCMTERHPTLRCSLSDHLAVEAVIEKNAARARAQSASRERQPPINIEHHSKPLEESDLDHLMREKSMVNAPPEHTLYLEILEMIRNYGIRERQQRRYRLSHFLGSCFISIGCFIATWWSPRNYVSFILILLSSLGLMAGTVDGLIGGLFIGSELRALKEFEWEVRNALELAGGEKNEETQMIDWYG